MIDLRLDDIPVWLINLPASTTRAASMHRQLTALGIAFKQFDAVDGRKEWDSLKSSIDIPAFERNVGRHILPGEIGCYHSHLQVWQAFQETEAPVALVIEDDVVFHDNFRAAVDAALKQRSQWDVLKLNHIRAKFPRRRFDIGQWQACEYLGSFTGTGAYLISQDVLPKLLDNFLPITRPIDHELDRSYLHNFRHYGLSPYPSHVLDMGQSTITGENFAGMKKFPRYQRLPNYFTRLRNFAGKLRAAAKAPLS